MIQVLKHTGWVVLSALCFFIVFFFVQWLTFEVLDLLLIQNHFLLFVLSGLVGLAFPKWYGLIGGIILSCTVLGLMLLADNLTFELLHACALLTTGGATGSFIRRKKRIGWIASFLTGSVVLFSAYQKYSSINVLEVSAAQKTDASRFNVISADFVSMNGEKFHISQDTVYLINFTFYACKPCRNKRPSLELLEKEFQHKPFKLVTVHCVEPKEVFKKYYNDYANCYYNADNKAERKLGIPSYPYEIIFDKKGYEVRRFNGFSLDAKDDYEQKTRDFIKKLINEKS